MGSFMALLLLFDVCAGLLHDLAPAREVGFLDSRNCSGVLATTSAPSDARRSAVSACLTCFTMAEWSFAMTGCGVFAGANTPNQPTAS